MEWTVVSYKKEKKHNKKIEKPNVQEPVTQPKNISVKNTTLTKFRPQLDDDEVKLKRVSQAVADEIRNKRLARNWTQKELAKRCNVNVKIISDIESGQALHNGKTVEKIRVVLQAPQ